MDVVCFHLYVAYVAVAIHVWCKFMFQMFNLFQTYVASALSECCICCSCYTHMLQAYVSICFTLFQYVAASAASHTLWLVGTHALTQLTLPISVMRASSNSWTCTQRAVSAQTVEHSLVKVHVRMQSARVGQNPTDAELGALHHQAWPTTVQHVAGSTHG